MGMSSGEYRESLRRMSPRVFVDGRQIESVADDPVLAPGANGIGFTYDYALKAENRPLALAHQHTSGKDVSRLVHINQTTDDLMAKLELVRVLCQETGCAMRYLTHDGFNALFQSTKRTDEDCGWDCFEGRC